MGPATTARASGGRPPMNTEPTPLFLLSLPRSGSTLAQRILAAHEAIATASEPWVLLPYLYTLRERGAYAEYGHRGLVRAVEDFCDVLPRGRDDYVAEIRELALRLYRKASPAGTRYFLDKTPRYHLVADEILDLFPEAKYLILWRNPLAVVASIIETWAGGKWNLYRFKVDLFDGTENLLRIHERHGSKVHALRYEALITEPEETWTGVFRYLGLPFDDSVLSRFADVELAGRWGDQSGTGRYDAVSSEPLESWKRVLNNPVRKAWCRRYLRWIGHDKLAVMGYDLDLLCAELDALPTSYRRVGSDLGRGGWGLLRDLSEPHILGQKLLKLPQWKRVHVHR
jgi:Sulfotransferase family